MTDTMTTSPASREVPLEPGGSVDIVLAASHLRLRGIDGNRVIVRSRDGDPLEGRVRIEAAAALGDGGFREALRPLLEKKASDASPEVRQAAASALRKLQPR